MSSERSPRSAGPAVSHAPSYPRIPYGMADFKAIRLQRRLYVGKFVKVSAIIDCQLGRFIYLVLRLTETDAKALVRNVATARQERTLIDRIKQMDRFKALYFCEGKHRPSSVKLNSLD